MRSEVFYRKYRPQKFSDLVGQGPIAETLLAQLESGKIGHGYLFWGQRGTGKTSTARIFAKAVNCEKYGSDKNSKIQTPKSKFGEPCGKCNSCLSITNGTSLDLIEIDAASNRGIDEIRDLREKVKLSPVSAKFKVYIVDEAHMLTTEAFNALLKTLEEPPRHVIFILCTTELGKLPATIVSRLQRFNFQRATNADISKMLIKISKDEGIKIEEDSTMAIATAADGSFRDAVSLLDQLGASGKKVSPADVFRLARLSGWNQLFEFANSLASSDIKGAISTIEEIAEAGGDVPFFAKQVIIFLEKVLFLQIGLPADTFSDYDEGQLKKVRELSEKFDSDRLQELIRSLAISENEMKLYPLPQIPMVLAVCKYLGVSTPQNEVLEDDEGGLDQDELVKDRSEQKKPEKVVEKPDFKKVSRRKVSYGDIEKNWSEFLNRVKRVNAHVVALLRSTKPVDFDGRVITLEVFYRFHKEKLEEPKILSVLDKNMGDLMKKPIGFKFVLAKKESKPTSVVSASDVVDIRENELELIAQEIFSK